MGRQIVGGAAGRCRHQHAVGDQLLQPHLSVHRDAQARGLMRQAEQMHLVDGERLGLGAVLVDRLHPQGMNHINLRPGEPFGQLFLTIFVHEEADSATVHAINGDVRVHVLMQRLKHEAIAAERDDDVGLFGRRVAVTCAQAGASLHCLGGIARYEGDASDLRVDLVSHSHGTAVKWMRKLL